MKILTLLRHAKSSWAEAGLTDFDRPLNRRGEADAPTMGKRLAKSGLHPTFIVSSPAMRAISTAKIVAGQLNYPLDALKTDEDLYHASLDTLLDVVAAQDDSIEHLMLVGHNPGLTTLANYFLPGITDNLPTAGVLSIQIDSENWSLYSGKDVELLRFDYPKKLAAH